MSGIEFSRYWAMPTADTFECEPIKGFVQKYLLRSAVSVDPFARNSRFATWRNDLNPETQAEYHLEAKKFLGMLSMQGIRADLLLLDPPYSPRQVSECYKAAAVECGMIDTQSSFWTAIKDASMLCLNESATVLSFGWNSSGMGRGRGFEIVEVLLVCHGGAHNDTICLAEKRCARPMELTL